MGKSISAKDSLKHVSFAGRPGKYPGLLPSPLKRPSSTTGVSLPNQSEKSCQFISTVLKRAGMNPHSYRVKPLLRMLPACLRALRADSETHAIEILGQQPELLSVAVSSLLIGITEFFRDSSVFETLRTEVLPQLASHGRPLRVWSAGCSNGAELYSVAILLAQAGLLDGSYLLGTDCRYDALECARGAIYDLNQVQKIRLSDQCIYFTRAGINYRPIAQLYRNIHWRVADLMQRIEQGPWDIILWRNMAIYLTAEAAEPIWQGLVSELAPGGALVVGRAERPPASLQLANPGRCIFRN